MPFLGKRYYLVESVDIGSGIKHRLPDLKRFILLVSAFSVRRLNAVRRVLNIVWVLYLIGNKGHETITT